MYKIKKKNKKKKKKKTKKKKTKKKKNTHLYKSRLLNIRMSLQILAQILITGTSSQLSLHINFFVFGFIVKVRDMLQ